MIQPPPPLPPPLLDGLQCQAAGHPEYTEMDYDEEQPLDMSIKGKSVNYSSNGSSSSLSSSTSPSIDFITSPSSSSSTRVTSQVNRPSVITCASSLKVKHSNNSATTVSSNHNHSSSDVEYSHKLNNRTTAATDESNHQLNSMSPKSNSHSQDTIIANETAKLNISTSVTFENPVDEHFRRSLGGLFSSGLFKGTSNRSNSNSSKSNTHSNSEMLKNCLHSGDSNELPVKLSSSSTSVTSVITEVSTDVDDHFAKALGADWIKLRKNEHTDHTTTNNTTN